MELLQINHSLFRFINNLGKQFPSLDPIIIFIAEYLAFILAFGVIIIWFTRHRQHRRMIMSALIAFFLAEILGVIASSVHFNNQPFCELTNVNQLITHEVDNSFPSDHTILFFSFCLTFWLFQRKGGWMWISLAIGVGISRIWVGVHYPFDVAAGIILSTFAAMIAFQFTTRLLVVDKVLIFYEKLEQRIFPNLKKKDSQQQHNNGKTTHV
ncbi:hypothetical protein M948_07140 [Virgibacillus sp. CM-4]|uniref:undecaprenyl-diphosphatase n=1 Tax=Virgibacillus sp. CM-4 TaxID=1354277 RepID=UPI0003889046|nr:undecaprenyl-diphosphatase [Virgibacillus sp. CM-4]EQB38347.1 hypothetical protein M948_07140 [Virgibacillus sp. CM-4]